MTRVLARAFLVKQFAERDRRRFQEALGDVIARMNAPLQFGPRVQEWQPGGPYPMVNVDTDSRIAYGRDMARNRFLVATVSLPEISVCPPGCELPPIGDDPG